MYKKTFEKLFIWEGAVNLFEIFYGIFNKNGFKDYFFRDQILRAALSISNNIAEGYERCSIQEEIRFLYIAKGSAGEVRNMLIIAEKLGFINKTKFEQILESLVKITAGIYSLILSKERQKAK